MAKLDTRYAYADRTSVPGARRDLPAHGTRRRGRPRKAARSEARMPLRPAPIAEEFETEAFVELRVLDPEFDDWNGDLSLEIGLRGGFDGRE